jgi:peptidyl-prolyl cis-trans isomerase SurA
MRAVFDRLQPGHASEPLVAQDGIAVVMVCARDQQQAGLPSKTELADRILDERVERISRQLMRDLERRAVIEQRA